MDEFFINHHTGCRHDAVPDYFGHVGNFFDLNVNARFLGFAGYKLGGADAVFAA